MERVFLVTKDLFFVPIIRSAAENHGLQVRVVPSCQSPLLAELDTSRVIAGLLDLSAISLADFPAEVDSLKAQFPAAQLLGFGPHVHANRLEAATEAGVHRVLTRGQLHAQADQIMAGFIADSVD